MPPPIPISRFAFVNAYLVREDDGFTVVDTMLPGSAKPILEAARRAGAQIVRIALTHAHGDHIGSLDALAEALPGVEVLISSRDARLLAKDRSMEPGEPDVKLRGGYPGAKTPPTSTFEARDELSSARALRTLDPARLAPGHGRTVEAPGAAMDRAIAAAA